MNYFDRLDQSLAPVTGRRNAFDDLPQGASDSFAMGEQPLDQAQPEAADQPQAEMAEVPTTPIQPRRNAFDDLPTPEEVSFGDRFLQGIDQMQQTLYGGVEAIGAATGLEGVRAFGVEGRVRNAEEAKAYGVQQELLKAKGIGDIANWAKSTIAQQLPQMGVTAGSALTGAAIGSVVPGVGTLAGGLVGAAIPSFVMGAGEVQGALKEKAPTVEAPGYVLGGGAAIAALDSIVPGRIGGALVRRFGTEAAGEIAKRTIAKEAFKSATIEGATEAIQEAIQEVTASGGADQTPDWPHLPSRMVEAGAAGALLGGLFGGGAAAIPSPSSRGDVTPQTGEGSAQQPPPGAGAQQVGGTAMSLDPTAQAPEPKWYYSQVRASVEALPDTSLTGEQWLEKFWTPETKRQTTKRDEKGQVIRDVEGKATVVDVVSPARPALPGTKQEELEALGILDWLKGQKGPVSKEDVIAEIEANAVNVETIMSGGGNARVSFQKQGDGTWKSPESDIYIAYNSYAPLVDRYQVVGDEGRILYYAANLEAAQGFVTRAIQQNRGEQTTQYDEYVLPLGRNYREVKLTLPAFGERAGDQFVTPAGQIEPRNFQSEHFLELNIIGHDRMTDRTTTTGERTLHSEEKQSDWHQQGRERGYQGQTKTLWTSDYQDSRVRYISSRLGPIYVRPFTSNKWLAGFQSNPADFNTEAEAVAYAEKVYRDTLDEVPDAPFKTNWAELFLKRHLAMAVEGGYDRITWSPGHVHVNRWRQTGEEAKGQLEFYDKILPRFADKWAKKLGSRVEKVSIPAVKNANGDYIVNEGGNENATMEVWSVPITPQMRSTVAAKGFPLFSLAEIASGVYLDAPAVYDATMVEVSQRAFKAVKALVRGMGVRNKISLVFRKIVDADGRRGYGQGQWFVDEDGDRQYIVSIDPSMHKTSLDILATLAHEFGHIVMWERWDDASPTDKLRIELAYSHWKETRKEPRLDDRLRTRDNFILSMRLAGKETFKSQIAQLSQKDRDYWLGFDEWFAEQVARWVTTDETPLSVIDKFFASIGKQIRKIYVLFQKTFGITATPHQFVADWLNSLLAENQVASFEIMLELEKKTQAENQRAMAAIGAKEFPAKGRSLASESARSLLAAVPGDEEAQRNGKAAGAAVDYYNSFLKWMISMVQLADLNKHIAALQRYRELWQMKQAERTTMLDMAQTNLKAWRKLTEQQQTAVSKMIDAYMNMTYLSVDDKINKVVRRPSEDVELPQMFREHGVSQAGQEVFKQLRGSFDIMLDKYEKLLVQNATTKLADNPVKLAEALQGIKERIDVLKNQPYFPAFHFGDYTITIRHAGGGVVHFETFESKRRRDAAFRELKRQVPEGGSIHADVIAPDVKPFLGIPSALLDLMAEKLALSDTQRAALDQLRFENSPAHAFKHRLSQKTITPGYSSDFVRAYANYFFHASNYFSNLKYVDALRDQIKQVHDEAGKLPDGTKRRQIAIFMEDHLKHGLDPKPDFAFLRGMAFLWFLGFSPAAATLNLSQIIVGSVPFLGSKFGDLKAVAAIGKAGGTFSTYYRRGSLEGLGVTDRDLKGLSEGVKEGVITEAMAPELAALSEGRTLGKGFGGNAFQRGWTRFMELSSLMFEMSEQANRRITFRAAWQLASDNPNTKYVKEAVEKHRLQFERLKEAGWNDLDAGAFVTAKDAVETTQYVYQQYAQPRFMRGRLRTIFVFKTFVQNTLFMLWNYPTSALRSLLIMGFLGGLMGLPGADDLRGILKALAWKLFGRDFDIEEEARRTIKEMLSDQFPPDVILHGMARRGFGLPTVLDSLGVPLGLTKDWKTVWQKFQTGRSPADAATLGPNFFDRSKAIGLGHLLPLDFGALFGPPAAKDANRAIADSAQRASGAVFGTFFNIYKAMEDAQTSAQGFKVWERAFPRFAASASKGMRAYLEGGERDSKGNTVIKYDTTDPRQMAEVIGLSMGYQPLRLTAQWDRRFAEMEAITYWNIRRQTLLNQAWASRGDKEQYDRALNGIREFNKLVAGTPARGKAITGDVLSRSFQTRQTASVARESGVPRVAADIPLVREIQKLYPEAEVDVRRVR